MLNQANGCVCLITFPQWVKLNICCKQTRPIVHKSNKHLQKLFPLRCVANSGLRIIVTILNRIGKCVRNIVLMFRKKCGLRWTDCVWYFHWNGQTKGDFCSKFIDLERPATLRMGTHKLHHEIIWSNALSRKGPDQFYGL